MRKNFKPNVASTSLKQTFGLGQQINLTTRNYYESVYYNSNTVCNWITTHQIHSNLAVVEC